MSATSPREVVGIGRPIPSTEPPDFEQAAHFLTLLDKTAERDFAEHLQALPTMGGAQ